MVKKNNFLVLCKAYKVGILWIALNELSMKIYKSFHKSILLRIKKYKNIIYNLIMEKIWRHTMFNSMLHLGSSYCK